MPSVRWVARLVFMVMLDTFARIGTVLPLRRCASTSRAPLSVCITGTILTHCGEPVQRQDGQCDLHAIYVASTLYSLNHG